MRRGRSILRAVCWSFLAASALFFVLLLVFPLPPLKSYSLFVTDRNGKFLQAFLTSDDKWRLKTSPDEIPARLKYILVKKEDRFFYYHPGVNPVSIVRALAQNMVHGKRTSGASTITMQVARMLEPKERTYGNKLFEMFRALQLELHYTKDEILGMYLSMIPVGGNVEGLKSASYVYYQTPVERLNIAQLIDLISIPANPNRLRPDRRADLLLDNRLRLARTWVKRGILSPADSCVIWQTGASAVRSAMPRLAPHFCLRVNQLFGQMYRGSADVRTSLDLRLQSIAESHLSNHLRDWRQRGVMNGAAIVLRNGTREVLAYAGSENFADESAHGQVDAVVALRSPGSTLKPFLYAMEMEQGELTPKTRLLDTPYDAEGFSAENYDGTYSGAVYADVALRHSLNVPMIRLLHTAGTKPFVEFLGHAGFNSLASQKDRLGLSLIVGGCGVTLEELAGAYAVFPAGGTYVPPSYLRAGGEARPREERIFSKSTAYMVTEILAGLDRPDIPNNFESSLNLPRIAFKTGTSYGRRDAWAVGYSAEYTVGVWLGNVTNEGSADLVSRESAGPLLIDIFNSVSSPHQKEILPRPNDLLTREVCVNSGLPPNGNCSRLIDDDYAVLRTRENVCDIDKEVMVSPDGKVSYCPTCLGANRYRMKKYEDYPGDLLTFWNSAGKPHDSPPPHNPFCTRVFSGEGPHIVSPSDNMTYYLFSEKQHLALQASSGAEVAEHIWYLDDAFLCRVKPHEKYFVRLKDGEHTLSCMDDKGRMSRVTFRVRATM